MATPAAQDAVAEYHLQLQQQHGHSMAAFHVNWHGTHPDPQFVLTEPPDRAWAETVRFGGNFLQMHHEMVFAADTEPKRYMQHPSIVSWYASKGYTLPGEWDPLTPIPEALAFTPTDAALQRRTDDPHFALPGYFTLDGIRAGEQPHRYTGARKLSDFSNVNQLGCAIVWPHNDWHVAIGGAMLRVGTAIMDPVFYFGVHWHIDRIFRNFLEIVRQRAGGQPNHNMLPEITLQTGSAPPPDRELTEADLKEACRATEISNQLAGRHTRCERQYPEP